MDTIVQLTFVGFGDGVLPDGGERALCGEPTHIGYINQYCLKYETQYLSFLLNQHIGLGKSVVVEWQVELKSIIRLDNNIGSPR